MLNYYEILGLKKEASAFEIKTAFRQLAKLYHPDKNPEGKDHFSKVLKAYETLINPEAKTKYDYKLQYAESQSSVATKVSKKKYEDFEERELKRRKYYEEHIKKYEKKKAQTVTEPEIKTSYNEFKYILFATPLAVILFLLIVNLASNDRTVGYTNDSTNSIDKDKRKTFKNTNLQNPFSAFGENRYDYDSEAKLLVENKSGALASVCVYNYKKEFIRGVTLKPTSSLELLNLSKDKLLVIYRLENSNNSINEQKSEHFYKSLEFKRAESINPLTLLPQTTKGFIKISRDEFFEYSK